MAFISKNYTFALYEYNKSVMTAEIDSKYYSFALANCSLVLYYLEDACLSNIPHALVTKNDPNELMYKLYEREVKCLQKIGKIPKTTQKSVVSILSFNN